MHKYYCLNLWMEDNNHDDSDKNGALSTATSPAQEFCTTTRSMAVYCSLVTSKAETFPIIIIVFTISGALKESSRRCWLMLIKFSFNLFSWKQDHLHCGLSLSPSPNHIIIIDTPSTITRVRTIQRCLCDTYYCILISRCR